MSKRKKIGSVALADWTLVVMDDGSARLEYEGAVAITGAFIGPKGSRIIATPNGGDV